MAEIYIIFIELWNWNFWPSWREITQIKHVKSVWF